jgi:hypothetical protein
MGADTGVTNNDGFKVVNFINEDTPEGINKEEWNTVVARIYQAFTPKNHKVYMNIESYKNSFEKLNTMIERIKKTTAHDEYMVIVKENYQIINNWSSSMVKEGLSEVSAYEDAYTVQGRYLYYEWLRWNAEGVQGLYGQRENAAFVLTIEKTKEKDKYAVVIAVHLNDEPYIMSFPGVGKLSGAIMTMPYENDENAFIITFEGENAKVKSSQAFKDTYKLGVFDTFDGTYERDRHATDPD